MPRGRRDRLRLPRAAGPARTRAWPRLRANQPERVCVHAEVENDQRCVPAPNDAREMRRAERLPAPDRNPSTEQARCRIYETPAGGAKSKKVLRRIQDVPLRSACQASRRRRPRGPGRHARRLRPPRRCSSRRPLRPLNAWGLWRRDARGARTEPLGALPPEPRREESGRGTCSKYHPRRCKHEGTAAPWSRRRRDGLLRPQLCGLLDGPREL